MSEAAALCVGLRVVLVQWTMTTGWADNQRSLHRRQGPGSHAALEDQQADRLQEFRLTEFLCKKWVKWHSTGGVQLDAKSKSDAPTQMPSLQRNLI